MACVCFETPKKTSMVEMMDNACVREDMTCVLVLRQLEDLD